MTCTAIGAPKRRALKRTTVKDIPWSLELDNVNVRQHLMHQRRRQQIRIIRSNGAEGAAHEPCVLVRAFSDL